jgi:hypothetical protein
MPILNPNPITIPETYEQTFDELFLTKINFNIESPTKGCGFFILKPYDPLNEEVFDQPLTFSIENIWETAETIPEIRTAIDAIISGVSAYYNYVNSPVIQVVAPEE